MTADEPTDVGDPAAALGDAALVVVSNRQPYQFDYDGDEVAVDRPAGGLTAGLDPVLQRTGGTWVAWGDGDADEAATDADGRVQVPPEDPAYTMDLVPLSEDAVEGYYYGYSNQVLWPLCHGGIWQTSFAERHWEVYQEVNRVFADATVEAAPEDAVVWFQDYHLARTPQHVRAARPDTFLVHFWHITWPGWDTFRSLPHRKTILSGLLGNDLIGFHVDRYCENFLDCVDRALSDATVDAAAGTIRYHGRTITVDSFPLGVDADRFAETARAIDDERQRELAERYDLPTAGRIALGVDRLDYTKGIPERIEALEHLWETRPEWRGELTYVQKADESRSVIPNYRDLQERVAEAIARVNDRFGTPDWQPIVRIDDYLPEADLVGLYRLGDVMLVSALRDGMNLVAKEYVASQVDDDGVLVLSDQAGAHDQLGDDAVSINPHNDEGFANAIEEALSMPDDERRHRMARLREVVSTADLSAWMADLFGATTRLRSGTSAVADG